MLLQANIRRRSAQGRPNTNRFRPLSLQACLRLERKRPISVLEPRGGKRTMALFSCQTAELAASYHSTQLIEFTIQLDASQVEEYGQFCRVHIMLLGRLEKGELRVTTVRCRNCRN